MEYQVVVVEDSELPEGTPWAVARRGEIVYLVVTRTRHAMGHLEEAWAAWDARHDGCPVAV